MRRLAEINRPKLIEVLGERLAFERQAVRLYDVALLRMEDVEPALARMRPRLELQRDQEREHAEYLEGVLAALEGDGAAGGGRRAALVAIESQGVSAVVGDGASSIADIFHALLTAELADGAGWELLVELAEAAGDRPAIDAFARRAEEELLHAAFLRRALAAFLRNDVIGAPETMPIE